MLENILLLFISFISLILLKLNPIYSFDLKSFVFKVNDAGVLDILLILIVTYDFVPDIIVPRSII